MKSYLIDTLQFQSINSLPRLTITLDFRLGIHIRITLIKRTCGKITFTKDEHDKTEGEVLIYLSLYINVSLRTDWNRVIYSEEKHGFILLQNMLICSCNFLEMREVYNIRYLKSFLYVFYLSEKCFSVSQSSLIKNTKLYDKICGAIALLTRMKKELAFQ